MHLCCFSLIASEIFKLTKGHWYQFVGEVMADILNTKEIIQPVTLWIPKGTTKMQYLVLLLLALTF